MEGPEIRTLQAREVYVLMKKDYRISRNIRASWFFNHLNKTLSFTPRETLVDTDEEIQVASVVSDDGTPCLLGHQYNVALLPSTMVTFVARQYRFVIILDLSPSVSSVDTSSCSVLYEKVHSTLANFLHGLVLPFHLPSCCALLYPDIFITVIAYSPLKSFISNQVLVQGLKVNCTNIETVARDLALKLESFESVVANNFSKVVESNNSHFASSNFDVRPGMFGSPLPKEGDIVNNPEAGIVNMIRSGLLALQLLPENSSSGLVVITDGCLGVLDASLFEFLLTQLRTSTISCSFLRIGEPRAPFGHFGHIPHTELMQFIATATCGSYFDKCPDVTGSESKELNIYHKAVFLWRFQKGLEGFRYDLGDQNLMLQQSSPAKLVQRLLSHPIHGKLASVMPNVRKRQLETNLNTSLFSVLSVRLREGYTIRDIAITKGETQIEVRMVLPWREYARFEYLARSAWPLDNKKNITHTEITLEGSYDFLHDMTCTKMNSSMMSTYRSANVKKFWLALQGLSRADQFLVHLQSFSSNSVYYTLPESIKNGVPLFYLPHPNSTVPSLSTQLNSKDPNLTQFASFWRPVVNLDIKIWQKWMHTHRIGLVLEHDTPLHKNLHIPNSSGRHSMVICGQAVMALNMFLTEWSTFVLLDGQSYIKLLFDSDDKNAPPCSFLLLKITSKAPCLVLRLAFLGGTPGYRRHKIVEEVKTRVAKLKFRERGPKTDKNRRSAMAIKHGEKDRIKKAPLLREWSEIQCCVLLKKPVESILIRYEGMPRDMTLLEDQEKKISHFIMSQTQAKHKTAANQFNSLCRYLLHQRWIWTVQQSGVNSISMIGVGRILSTLVKSTPIYTYRMRIQQGFHFGMTNSGIVNMMLEIDMKIPRSCKRWVLFCMEKVSNFYQDSEKSEENKSKQSSTCVVQYILFPPYVKTSSDSLSDDEDGMESTEDDGELQIITECWVEPQYGIATNNTPERTQFEGLTCNQLSKIFYDDDINCISSLITFEHLMYLCQNSAIPADLSTIVNQRCDTRSIVSTLSPTIQQIAFPFDLLSLLARSQQAEHVYPIYSYEKDTQRGSREANGILLSLLFDELRSSSHKEVTLSKTKSLQFLKSVESRSRNVDINPWPVDITEIIKQQDDAESAESDQKQEKIGRPRGLTNTSKQTDTDSECVKSVPQWKCFIKAVNTGALVLTFIPATFEDLLLLNGTDKNKIETPKDGDAASQAKADDNANIRDNDPPNVSGNSAIDGTVNTPATSPATAGTSDKPEDEVTPTHEKQEPNINGDINGDARPESETVPEQDQPLPNGHLEENKENEAPKPSWTVLKFPVYVYDCIMTNITNSLVNPWDFTLPADIYQDMTFDDQQVEDENMALPSPKGKKVSFDIQSLKDGDDDVPASMSRSQERRSTEGSNEGGENLWQQCSALSEMYFNCYVKGVFQSLQKGYSMCGEDVDAAINNICEESLPLETDITTFLHSSCSHFQHLVNEVRRDSDQQDEEDLIIQDDVRRLSVRFADLVDDTELEMDMMQTVIPGVLKVPHSKTKLDINTLHLDRPCEPVKDLHPLIKDKFIDTVQKWFRPVPASPDYYYYCPDTPMSGETSDEPETTTSDGIVLTVNADVPESDTAFEMPATQDSGSQKNEKSSTNSELDSEESMMDDDLEYDLDQTREEDKSNQTPLFLIFTCTVKCGLKQYSVSLRNIAACLSELSTILGNFTEVDPGDLKITFDLNCLTLPTDLDLGSPRKLSFLRQFSTERTSFSSTESIEVLDRASSSNVEFQGHKDPVGHLPPGQQDAVKKCMEEIKWLLRDEIVSNLRHIPPIQSDALNYVVKHIQTSALMGKANVYVDNVPLQFVYGTEQSEDRFIEEFKVMNLQSYQLVSEEEWYYLSRKRITTYSYVNALALSSALSDLSHSGGKLVPATGSALSPRSLRDLGDMSDHRINKSLSPLVMNAKDRGFDIGAESIGRSSPLTVKSDQPEVKRHSRESSLTFDKKVPLSTDSLEDLRLNLINRRKSRELVLKMGKEADIHVESRRSKELPESENTQSNLSPRMRENDDKNKNGAKEMDSNPLHKLLSQSENIQPETDTEKGQQSIKAENGSVVHPNGGIKQTSISDLDSTDTSPITMSLDSRTSQGNRQVDVTPTGRPDIGTKHALQKRVSLDSPDFLKDETSRLVSGNVSSSNLPSQVSPLTLDHGNISSSNLPSQVSPLTIDHGTFSSPGTPSQSTPSVYSPLITDVSIQLTKTDGQCEPFQSSPEHGLPVRLPAEPDFDDNSEIGGSLKRCSSFAGFRSRESCEVMKPDYISSSQAQSPIKPLGAIPQGILGRARHCSAPISGHGTPKSRVSTLPQTPSYESSRGSFTEDGNSYDGDMSETDDAATVYSELGVVARAMPEFWLIMQINKATVNILYQHSDLDLDEMRETGKESKEDKLDQRSLLTQVKEHVENTCRKVNQQLLLNNLYETRMCHALLVDAADEDVSWGIDKGPKYRPRSGTDVSGSENDNEDDDDTFEQKYLAAAMDLDPGYFDCPLVWKHMFYIHPGLKRGGRGSVMSIGVKALRTALALFSVKNRNNMFVIREQVSRHVFYLRLKEVPALTTRSGVPPNESTDSLSLSAGLKQESLEVTTNPENDPDTVSLCSTSSVPTQPPGRPSQDCVEMHVHGIEEAGPEIKENLVELLQKKLDEASLDKIVEMLRRNPLCQLEKDDVQFIQKPCSEPTTSLHLILSNKASTHLVALMFYFRQNLLQYLNTPKYKTSNTEHHFIDMIDGKWTSIPPDQVFLYIPKHMRKNGIACVSICLVDGHGNQVRPLPCTKPSGNAYSDIERKEDLEDFIVTQDYTMSPNSRKPGPTSLIQFRIWSIGDLDIAVLKDTLRCLLRNALCDVLTEFYMLTAPLCEIPKHLVDVLPHPPYTVLSAPTSPYCSSPQVDEFRERKLSMVALRKRPDLHKQLDRRSSLQQGHFKFGFSKLEDGNRGVSPSPDPGRAFDMSGSPNPSSVHEAGSLGSKHGDVNSLYGKYESGEKGTLHQIYSDLMEDWLLQCHLYDLSMRTYFSFFEKPGPGLVYGDVNSLYGKYESGEKGTLHQIYSDLMEDWLLQCHAYGSPAISKMNHVLKSKISVDYVLQEFQNMVTHIYSGNTTKIYKLLPSEEVDETGNIGVLYNPNRSPLECTRRRSETSLDLCVPRNVIPGEDHSYIVISRDMSQWYSYIQHATDDTDGAEFHKPTARGNLPLQKFAPQLPYESTDTKSSNQNLTTPTDNPSFIPRQRFAMLSLRNKELQTFTYNWTTDNVTSLSKLLTKLVSWSNARTHLLSNVVIQKCGLFSHCLFTDGSFLDKMSQQLDSLDQLIDSPAPPPPNKERLSRSHSNSSVRDSNYLPFDSTFKDLYPSKPLHMSHLACETDLVKQYGRQVQDVRVNCKRDFERINSIRNLYVMWVQKTSPNYPIGEDIIRTLKQASRLFHYCATPLLFSTKWRQNVIEKYKVTRQASVCSTTSTATPDLKSRSRHGSGASVGSSRTKRSESADIKRHPSLQTFKEIEDTSQLEEDWHVELRSRFIRQYIEYIQTIGFNYVQLSKLRDAQRRHPNSAEELKSMEETHFKPTDVHNLQKTVSGGVLLIELSFRQEYFCVKFYTCDHNKLGITVNQQLKLLFVDECEKCKDIIHVHSFAHDFHLRCIQSYISGEQNILTSNYYLTGLLADFVKVYPYAPSFSRNFMQRDVITIPEPSCTATDLYDYMLRHAKLHAMSVLKMTLPPEGDTDQDTPHLKNHQQALISHEEREITGMEPIKSSKRMEDYNIGLIILQDAPDGTPMPVTDKSSLSLQFYIILTTSQVSFPRHTLEKDLGNFMSKSRQSGKLMVVSANVKLKDQIQVKQPLGVLQTTTNYLGFSNKYQPPMYQLLQREAQIVREKIKNMAVESMEKCRRDSLWTKMLIMISKSDDQSSDDKRKKRSDTEDSRGAGEKCRRDSLWTKMLIMISKSDDQSSDDKRKKRSDTEDSRGPVSRLTYDEFCELLERVHKVPLHDLDNQLVPFQHMSVTWYQGLVHVLNTKYPETSRGCFSSQNSTTEYHVILNPKALEVFMLLSIDTTSGKTGLYVVFQETARDQDSLGVDRQLVLDENVQSHIEQFVNACCYHLWASMLL